MKKFRPSTLSRLSGSRTRRNGQRRGTDDIGPSRSNNNTSHYHRRGGITRRARKSRCAGTTLFAVPSKIINYVPRRSLHYHPPPTTECENVNILRRELITRTVLGRYGRMGARDRKLSAGKLETAAARGPKRSGRALVPEVPATSYVNP